jgi:hypothetical protein
MWIDKIIYLIGGVIMTRLDLDTIEIAKRHLEKEKVFTINELASLLKCSIPNARLKLKQWQTYTSYNKNGRFYALPHVPKFNQHGLWHHKSIAFSRHGNLKKTIIHLVNSAQAGHTGRELGNLLDLSPRSFLHHFCNCPGIRREKHEGVFVYFSDESSIYDRQNQQRISFACRSGFVKLSDSEAVIILVAVIRHHSLSAEDILALPEIKKSKIKLVDIQSFLKHHELEKKFRIQGIETVQTICGQTDRRFQRRYIIS